MIQFFIELRKHEKYPGPTDSMGPEFLRMLSCPLPAPWACLWPVYPPPSVMNHLITNTTKNRDLV